MGLESEETPDIGSRVIWSAEYAGAGYYTVPPSA